jgi:hypothetical protein
MSRAVYLVQRRGIEEGQAAAPTDHPAFVPFRPVRLFSSRAEAEAFARELEAAARQVACPFRLWPEFSSLTGLDEETMLGVVTGLGLPEPQRTASLVGGQRYSWIDWPAWWEQVVPVMTPEQHDCVWGLFEEGRLVEVVPMELGE